MMNWAILSGIEGNLAAYEAVLADLKHQPVDDLYILGDLVSTNPGSEAVVDRIRSPRRGELQPQVCAGWWEEQCFNLHLLGSTSEVPELVERYGAGAVKLLWDAVSRETVTWLRSLDFGIFELDCLMIHGSTASVSDELTPDTSPVHMLDRLLRADANQLFCGRSGLAFEYEVASSSISDQLLTLDGQQDSVVSVSSKRVIGVGNVGRSPGKASYVLYSPNSNRLEFKTVRYGVHKGFQKRAVEV